jgi:regulator of sigma D
MMTKIMASQIQQLLDEISGSHYDKYEDIFLEKFNFTVRKIDLRTQHIFSYHNVQELTIA